jgi:hypothetical protein
VNSKVKCPKCSTIVSLAEAGSTACPKCSEFLASPASTHRTARSSAPARGHTSARIEENSDAPYGVSLSGLLPMILAALAAAQAALLGRSAYRSVTIALALIGLISALAAIRSTRANRGTSDRTWSGAGAVLDLSILLAMFLAPGLLNSWWSFSPSAPRTDPHGQVVVPKKELLDEGRPAGNGWADAATEAVRVGDDVVVRMESAKTGRVAGMGDATYLLISLRIVNLSRATTVHFTGFIGDGVPVLTDASGRSLALKKQRFRKRVSGAPVFEDAPAGTMDIEINARQNPNQDVLLVYELPPVLEGLRLEVPGAAWTRKCTCRLQIAQLFDSLYPDKNE